MPPESTCSSETMVTSSVDLEVTTFRHQINEAGWIKVRGFDRSTVDFD
jgi:hypothetical protein